jgi:hypothetical protein
VNQISGTTPDDATAAAQDDSRPADAENARRPEGEAGFGARGRMRRRARFLRKARELAYRDLGGLVFNLHRFGQRNDALVMAKLTTVGHIDAELRTLETALEDRRPVTVLREAGITACARCAAIHSSEDRFCPNCGLSLGPHVDLPIAGAAASPAPTTATFSHGPAGEAAQPAAPPAAHPAPAPAAPSTPPPFSGAAPVPARSAAQDSAARSRDAVTAGRSPSPPGASTPSPGGRSPAPSGDDEPTEILHPPSGGQ